MLRKLVFEYLLEFWEDLLRRKINLLSRLEKIQELFHEFLSTNEGFKSVYLV